MTMQLVRTELGADPIVIESYFGVSPGAVYRAWTDPKIVMKCFGPRPNSLHSAEIDLVIGGAWRFVMLDDGVTSMGFEGTYLVVEPDKRLVMKWSKFTEPSSGPREASPLSQVDITLSSKGAGTDIRIVHSAIADKDTRIGFTVGWEHGIENLRDMFEGLSST